MEYLPVCLKLRGASALLVGGGSVALRKARLLLRAGARLTVVAPDACEELHALLAEEGGEWLARPYEDADLEGRSLVVAATSDAAVNRQVHDDARSRSLPVNVVDSPDLCTFIFPSIVDRSPLIIAISSSGASPVLARLWRRRIEAMIPAAYGRLASWAGRMRHRVKRAIPDESPRRLFWEQTVEGPVGELVLAGREAEAEERLAQQLAEPDSLYTGEVYLIGAGPGDPDLMTLKALRLLQRADVVLYDALVNPQIVELARRDAERIYVGKRRSQHTLPQSEISQRLVELAQAGRRVARLKGGDPFIFGRGGEEIDMLARHGVAFQVVPGITAASGAAAYAGIPLTHRDHAKSVRFVTGHLKEGELNLDWRQFLAPSETLVFYMGLLALPTISEQLIAHGRDPATPVALVENASTPEQRVVIGKLVTIASIAEREEVISPTLVIVGEVVRLHRDLAWFGAER